MVFSPLEQFEIFPIFLNQIAFLGSRSTLAIWVLTNSDLVVLIGLLEVIFTFGLVGNGLMLGGAGLAARVLSLVDSALSMTVSTVGRVAQPHVGIVLTLAIFVVLFNLLGLVPFGFCVTSHLIVTQFLGGFVVGGLTVKGVQNLGFRWLNLFLPRNVPLVMLPFLGVIELVSYVSRAFSLSIRLFANMVAGHALLHILMGALMNVLVLPIGSLGVVFGFGLPALLILAIAALELGIAFLQGYVFVTLYLIYLTDATYSH